MLESEHYWQTPYITWAAELPGDWALSIFYLRESRVKAKVPAILEVITLLGPCQPVELLGDLRSDQRDVFWVAVAPCFTQAAVQLCPAWVTLMLWIGLFCSKMVAKRQHSNRLRARLIAGLAVCA